MDNLRVVATNPGDKTYFFPDNGGLFPTASVVSEMLKVITPLKTTNVLKPNELAIVHNDSTKF